MRQTKTPLTLVIAVLTGHGTAVATDAFLPPETVPSKDYTVGLQVEFKSTQPGLDSQPLRDLAARHCAMMGKPYVNTVPIEDVGRGRSVVVQADGLSYEWAETKYAGSEQPGELCNLVPMTLRTLTTARFDGKQTQVTTYDYDTRTTGGRAMQGDHTYFGLNSANVLPSPDQFTKVDTGQQRIIAGLPCTVRRFVLGSNEMTYCATGSNPVRGRDRPISLAIRIGTAELEATSITPGVRVDVGALEGPSGFKPSKKSSPTARPGEGNRDRDSGLPRTNRSAP